MTMMQTDMAEINDILIEYSNVFLKEDIKIERIEDEERKFFIHMTNSIYNVKSVPLFRKYTSGLIISIQKDFIHILNKFTNNASLKTEWDELSHLLGEINNKINNIPSSILVYISISLLFLIRTSNRASHLYQYIKDKEISSVIYKKLVLVITYIKTFLENIDLTLPIKCQKNSINNASCTEDLDAIRKLFKQATVKKIEYDIQEKLEKLYQICDKLVKLFLRFQMIWMCNKVANVSKYNSSTVFKTLSDLKNSADKSCNQDIKKQLEQKLRMSEDAINKVILLINHVFSTYFVQNIDKCNQMTIYGGQFENVSKLICLFTNIVNLKTFSNIELQDIYETSEQFTLINTIHINLVNIYEALSGAVRVIVSIRDESNNDVIKGGKRIKNKYGGNMDLLDANYDIVADNLEKVVYFTGIDRLFNKFYANNNNLEYIQDKKPLKFGRFYSIITKQNSIDDILENSFNIETLMEQLKTTNKDIGNVLLYTFGYSGSGKTTILFNKDTKLRSGILWKLLDVLRDNGFIIELEKSMKLYGTLESDDGVNCYFKDNYKTITKNKNSNVSNIKSTSNEVIEKQYNDDITNTTDEFIKSTPNNPRSSRGFYILKFNIQYKNDMATRKTLGFIDMAGNEDPYDIHGTMLPTLNLANMKDIINIKSLNIYIYDVLYNTIYNALVDVIITILSIVFKPNYIPTTKPLKNQPPKLSDEGRDLIKYLSNDIMKKYGIKFNFNNLDKSKDLGSNWQIDYSYTDIKLHFVITRETILFLLQKEIEGETAASTNIKELLLNLKQNESNSSQIQKSILKFIVENNQNIIEEFKGSIMMNNNKKSTLYNDIKYIIKNVDIKTDKRTFPSRVVEEIKTKNDDIVQNLQKLIFKVFSEQPYIYSSNKDVSNKYSTIISIIKEGYYINQANAELINYLKAKVNNEIKEKVLKTNSDKTIDFEKNFSFQNYDKFKSVNDSQTYVTGLVPLICDEFGIHTKDILISCVTNKHDINKAMGSIDTLLLVKDLKST